MESRKKLNLLLLSITAAQLGCVEPTSSVETTHRADEILGTLTLVVSKWFDLDAFTHADVSGTGYKGPEIEERTHNGHTEIRCTDAPVNEFVSFRIKGSNEWLRYAVHCRHSQGSGSGV